MSAYGIYRERPRSAILAAVMLDRADAITYAERQSWTHGPHLVATIDAATYDRWTSTAGPTAPTLRYNDPSAPRYIVRCGDWNSRSPWQPYPAPDAERPR